jgi:hypothetical protein
MKEGEHFENAPLPSSVLPIYRRLTSGGVLTPSEV